MDLNGINMFLEYNLLVKHNPEVNWNIKTIYFTRYLKECKTWYQDISSTSRTQRLQLTDN